MEFFDINIANAVSNQQSIRSQFVTALEIHVQNNLGSGIIGIVEYHDHNNSNAFFDIPVTAKHIYLKSTDGNFVSQYPVILSNVAGQIIGTVNSKDELISLWNSDNSNKAFGKIYGGPNPYSFLIEINQSKVLDSIIGNPIAELEDTDVVAIADNTQETILFR